MAPRRPELETTFWDCDYQATRTMLNQDEAAGCSAAMEALMREFDGDFGALLAWWQRHKAAEHATREPVPSRAAGRPRARPE